MFKNMEKWTKIRLDVSQGDVSKREILRREGIHWDTLKKILIYLEPPGYQMKLPRPSRRLAPTLSESLRLSTRTNMKVQIRPQRIKDVKRFFEILSSPRFKYFPAKPKTIEKEKQYLRLNKEKQRLKYGRLTLIAVYRNLTLKAEFHSYYASKNFKFKFFPYIHARSVCLKIDS